MWECFKHLWRISCLEKSNWKSRKVTHERFWPGYWPLWAGYYSLQMVSCAVVHTQSHIIRLLDYNRFINRQLHKCLAVIEMSFFGKLHCETIRFWSWPFFSTFDWSLFFSILSHIWSFCSIFGEYFLQFFFHFRSFKL